MIAMTYMARNKVKVAEGLSHGTVDRIGPHLWRWARVDVGGKFLLSTRDDEMRSRKGKVNKRKKMI